MTYGDRMSARHRLPDDLDTADHQAGSGPLIGSDAVLLRVADTDRVLEGVRLEVDWMLGDVDPEFVRTDDVWTLDLPRPAAWRLEYQLTVRRDGDTVWTTDPGNPRQVPNPFGEKSEIRFPGLPGTRLAADPGCRPGHRDRHSGRAARAARAGQAVGAGRAGL